MKTLSLILIAGLCTVSSLFAQTLPTTGAPATPKRPVTDVYFGKAVVDNYRWLEDMNSDETKAWFKAQADYTNAMLDKIPGRDKLIETFVEYDKLLTIRYGEIKKRGNTYFYRKTLASEKAGKLYMREGKAGSTTLGPETLLFDPVAFDKSKTYLMTTFAPSNNGRKMSIGLQEGGAELSTVRIMDVATKTFGPESLTAVWHGEVHWSPDDASLLYLPHNSTDVKDPNTKLNIRSRLHRLGTDPTTDPDVFSRAKYPDMGIQPGDYPLVHLSDDKTVLFGEAVTVDSRRRVWMAPATELTKPTILWKRLCTVEDSIRDYHKLGSNLYLFSNKGAMRGKILVTDAANPDVATAAMLLPEEKLIITNVSATKDFLFVTLNDGINDRIRQYDTRSRQWADVPIPATGTMFVDVYDAHRSNEVAVYVTSWNNPGTLYAYDVETKKVSISSFDVQPNHPGLNDLVVEEIEIPSHDGTLVPLSLVYKKGLKRDGNNVCFMTGYGAYGSSTTPYFSRRNLTLMNKGVILAETHPRGGSEKGEAWYKAGYKTTKPNTWKDFIASGEYLIKNGYTSAGKLIGMGTSAGGILIGRAITERPDLFAAAISNVSCSNALRMENSPNGPINTPEFGTVKDSVECMALYEMDAMHHVKDGTNYPAVLCVGGWNDPRVIVWQPGKFAAALQNATKSGKPVLMQVNYDNGHFTEDKTVTFRNFANMYAFGLWQAGHPDFQPTRSGGSATQPKPTIKK